MDSDLITSSDNSLNKQIKIIWGRPRLFFSFL